MLNTSFSPWPSFTKEEADAVSGVLLSNRVNQWTGNEVRSFETEFAKWCGANHAVALANGTLALDLALHGLGIGAANGGSANDEVVVTPRSFIASVSCVVNAGAVPVFADVDLVAGNLSVETIKPVLTPRTKAVIPVHLAGWPCDMPAIMQLAGERGFKVIEDCAQAHGGSIEGNPLGSFGHVSAWSFCQDKIMSTGGEGGIVTCDDHALWNRMWSFKDHGKSHEAMFNRTHAAGFRWVHESIGTNWRMLEMQAAIGRIQLKRMDVWHAARKHNAEAIWKAAGGFSFALTPHLPKTWEHAYYKAYIHIDPTKLAKGWTRDKLIAAVLEHAVPCFHGGCTEIYLEKAFESAVWRPTQHLPHARQLGETSMMFLVHPTLTQAEIDKTCEAIKHVFEQASV